jgi:hypothetical protein
MPARYVTVDRETPMLHGLEKVSLEWILVTLAYNLRRLHTLGAVLKTA